MRKLSIPFLICVFIVKNLAGQVVITKSNFTSGPDSSFSFQNVRKAGLTLPMKGNNISWNYAGVTDTGSASGYKYLALPSTKVFDSATMIRDDIYVNIGGKPLKNVYYYGINKDGFKIYGFTVDSTVISLGSGSYIYFPKQTVPLKPGPFSDLAFPQKAVNTQRVSGEIFFYVTYFPLNNTPGSYKVTQTFIDSLAGYGWLSLPKYTKPFHALQIKRYEDRYDTMFLNGAPAPSFVLNQIGMQNGKVYSQTDYVFWGPQNGAPLLNIVQNDSGRVTRASYLANAHINSPAGISEVLREAGFRMFPNPVSGGSLSVQLEKADARNWTLQLMDMSGRVVCTEELAGAGLVKHEMRLPMSLPNGIYQLQVLTGNGVLEGGRVMVMGKR